jgi:hypothetical protein
VSNRVRRRRHQSFFARGSTAAGALVIQVWTRIGRRPVDVAAVATAIAASAIIVVNAIFLQSGMHAAPFFDAGKPASAKSESLKPLTTGAPARPVAQLSAAPQQVVAKHADAITDLIGPSPRIAAVQRALSEYGYGQIKITGMLDEATSGAIQKFEREHNMPSTGRVSDRLIKELAAMVGHPID